MPALPNRQPARWPETTGWGTSWGTSCSSSSAPTLPNLPQAIRLQAYDSTSDVTQPPAAVSGHKSCKVRDRINSKSNPCPHHCTRTLSSDRIDSTTPPIFQLPLLYLLGIKALCVFYLTPRP